LIELHDRELLTRFELADIKAGVGETPAVASPV
jgi:hypothetical protein